MQFGLHEFIQHAFDSGFHPALVLPKTRVSHVLIPQLVGRVLLCDEESRTSTSSLQGARDHRVSSATLLHITSLWDGSKSDKRNSKYHRLHDPITSHIFERAYRSSVFLWVAPQNGQSQPIRSVHFSLDPRTVPADGGGGLQPV